MATPPRVTDVQLSTTLRRIANRRMKHQDRALELMPDPDQCHPWQMLAFMRSHPASNRDRERADVADALTLTAWLWWQQRREELAWLSRGRKLGMFLSQLGAAFGVGKQGVADRMDRHEALLALDRPDEKITRDKRSGDAEASARREVEQAWVVARAAELSALVTALVAEVDRHAPELGDEDREWLDELARDARDWAWSPASMTLLGMAADEVATAPGVVALGSTRPYKVHHLLEQAARLRSEFAALTSG